MYHNEIMIFLQSRGLLNFTPRAALVDMDGTLYNSMPNHADAWMQLTAEYSIPATRNEFFSWEGRTGASIINEMFNRTFGRDATPQECEKLYHRKTELFAQMPPVEVMPGAQRLMKFLKSIGMKMVLVTGSGQSSLINRIEHDYPGIFAPDLRITSRDVKHGKPHPEPFIRAMELAGTKPEESIVIENAPLGVKAGRASKAFTFGINTGPIPITELEQAGADIVFPSMNDCADAMPLIIYSMITQSANFN